MLFHLKHSSVFPDKYPRVTMSPSRGKQTLFTVTCLRASAPTPAAAQRRGQPACPTCRFARCPSLPPSHPFLRTSQCLASGVPFHHHSFICWKWYEKWVNGLHSQGQISSQIDYHGFKPFFFSEYLIKTNKMCESFCQQGIEQLMTLYLFTLASCHIQLS